ncbi:MAG: DegV family EDD domain-containing protein [Deltaproteobacteria bacterium]|nr:DegV family EDD domain-containing protein [Deltaproteobacteria bacterium]
MSRSANGLRDALRAGSERLAAWSDLLDRINVFPVADGDTGRNLTISLSPLRDHEAGRDRLVRDLLLSARGNSGNIAARFFSGLLAEQAEDWPRGARRGRELAWQAVADPQPGTMLTLFDALVYALDEGASTEPTLERLERSVLQTRDTLPCLQDAGVVDAGALGMFIFWEAFLMTLQGRSGALRPIAGRFGDALVLREGYSRCDRGFCVDAVIERAGGPVPSRLREDYNSVVTISEGDLLKVHLHTEDTARAREALEGLGSLLRWTAEDLGEQTARFARPGPSRPKLHVMTDAAGSFTRQDARQLGVTLLHSYVTIGSRSVPETFLEPDELYAAMGRGEPVSTSQASDFERHQHFAKAVEIHGRALYLAVGSVYTGNVRAALEWKKEHDPDERLIVIDSGAASGRLGLAALRVARQALAESDPERIVDLARMAVSACEEYVFLDQLKFLAAGGRMSKTGAFFGDLLHFKPVVSPQPDGARKVAVLRDERAQEDFALERLAASFRPGTPGSAMLGYTDNRGRVERIADGLRNRFPGLEILIQPMSLTSGAHMGPGTWALAYLPGIEAAP